MLKNKIRYILVIIITGLLAILYNVYLWESSFYFPVLPIFYTILSYLSYMFKFKLNSDVHVANK